MSHAWYQGAVFYHIYTFSLADAPFYNEYGETQHRLSMIAKWIPHIKSLGCDAVLFSPALKSKSHGYDVTDYREIDNRIGTNEDFTRLVEDFHENGIRVVLDSVFNHCGRDFFAFEELKNGNREYAGWFSGVDFGRQSPMGDQFVYDTWSGYWELVKFNLKNDAVKSYLLGAARFWIEQYGIDGMRLDSANVMDFDFMRGLRSVCTGIKPDFWLMGEVVSGDYTRWVQPGLLHSVTSYMLFKALYSSHNNNNLFELAHTVSSAAPQNGLPLFAFADNHDQPRIASNVTDKNSLKTIYTLMYTLPGIPSIYYGSEWGIEGVKQGGSDAALRPYIDIDNPPVKIPELPSYLAKLAQIRRSSNALKLGGYRQIYLEYHRPYVFEREYGGEKIAVAVNICGNNESISLASYSPDGLADLLTGEVFTASQLSDIPLLPHSGRILAPQNPR